MGLDKSAYFGSSFYPLLYDIIALMFRFNLIDSTGLFGWILYNITSIAQSGLFNRPMRSSFEVNAMRGTYEVREHCDLVMDQYLRYVRGRVRLPRLTLATLAG